MDLLREIVLLTGLPEKVVEKDLMKMIAEKGYLAENLTVDQLREILADYMQDALLNLKSEYEGQPD
jgi:hypothetical protein